MLLGRYKKQVFYFESSLVMKSGYIMIIQKEENHGDYLAAHTSTSRAKLNIHEKKLMLWDVTQWDQLGVAYYELLNPSETITETLYRTQLMRLSRDLKEKRPQ
ncbi:Mariner Mos1 transposase [Eumeta japonica]|uniref:Mariner Mos1 transposase n=1 Tax=Eumeta variegata TaxID=151549 RepID=A0A4C1WG64_EUMVA|nr:Mariner Mos1 transposase [Eumeta japonica]